MKTYMSDIVNWKFVNKHLVKSYPTLLYIKSKMKAQYDSL
jgi:hypothetical protein